jgi:hypothetical protein
LSTILKALKRIDQNNPPQDDLQSLPPGIDTPKAVKGHFYRIQLRRKFVLVLVCVLVIIGAGWLAYNQKDLILSKLGSQTGPDKKTVFQEKIEPPPGQSKGKMAQSAAPRKRQKTPFDETAGQKPVSSERRSAASPQNRLAQENQKKRMTPPSPQTQRMKTKPLGRPRSSAIGSDQPRTRQPAPAPAPAKKTRSKPAQAARSYPRLDNAKLKLQAIAWSKVAVQRIAVINNRIVREGESVEGFSINQIRQEDVVVSDGSQSWQLEFGLR